MEANNDREEYPGCDESPEATKNGAWYKCSRCGVREVLHKLLTEDVDTPKE